MEVNKIVTVVLKKDDISPAEDAYQWNYGQILRIQGGNLPKAVEVHFSLEETSGTSVTRIGTTTDGVTEAPIPDSLLENNNCSQDYTIYAYIYLEDGTAGRTEYEIAIPVKARTKPEVPGTPEEPELFRETVKAVNAAADRAETAEQNAKASATEAGKYATSASESATAAEKTKEDALREVGEKKQEAIEAIQEQEETSVGKIINHTDNEIQRIQNQTAGSKKELEQTITNAGVSKEELDESIQTASDTKTALDKSVELAGTAKTELDMSIREAGTAKIALDESTETAGTTQETLSATVKQAGALDTSLSEKIETGTQLKTDLVASGEKAVQDIQNAGSEQLGEMQTVAEEFTADREQITTNREDISSLKEEMSKNYLDDAKTKRSLDALWKLNQGISYQFETDTERAYQKDIPSGAKLASVKKIGGRTIVWNQLANLNEFENTTINGIVYTNNKDGSISVKGTASDVSHKNINQFKMISSHKYYVGSRGAVCEGWLAYGLYVSELTGYSMTAKNGTITTADRDADASLNFHVWDGITVDITFYPQLVDLTQMFGVGNEPSTPEEFEALFPKDYYPYNEGTLMSTSVNKVDVENANLIKPSTNFIDKSGYASKGVEFTYDADKVITINGTFKEDIVGGSFGIINYKNLPRYGDYTISVFDENNMLASDVKFNTGENEQTFNYNANNGEMIITLVPTNGKTYINKKYYLQLIRGEQKKTYSPYHKNTYPIPQAILDLDGYGDGASDGVYNYVDWDNKQYHKRVGKVDLGSLDWHIGASSVSKKYTLRAELNDVRANKTSSAKSNIITALYTTQTGDDSYLNKNGISLLKGTTLSIYDEKYSSAEAVAEFKESIQGTVLYYELAEEQIIDISDIIDNTFQEPIEVEAGGTLTFQNSNGDGYRLPIPNEEEYIVSLAEVGGGGASE